MGAFLLVSNLMRDDIQTQYAIHSGSTYGLTYQGRRVYWGSIWRNTMLTSSTEKSDPEIPGWFAYEPFYLVIHPIGGWSTLSYRYREADLSRRYPYTEEPLQRSTRNV